MPTIHVSDALFEKLKALAEPLVDTPETVIQRLIDGQPQPPSAARSVGGEARPSGSKSVSRDKKRARKGERTRMEVFVEPLVEVLKQAGGHLPASQAIDAVGELMDGRLNEVDRGRLPSGEVRWRNTVRWAHRTLISQGKLTKKAPYGVWKFA